MNIQFSEFVKSSAQFSQCPDGNIPEYAFIGRSNVGKSSLINMLTDRKALAKISGKPGKTQLINHFLIDKTWYLVDLPGYGFAKISKSYREKWTTFTNEYLLNRKTLLCLFLLIDSRHAPQKIDLEFMEWLGENGIPFVITFTKTDKLKKQELTRNISTYKKTLLDKWEELPQIFITSSVSKLGQGEILDFIEATNKLF